MAKKYDFISDEAHIRELIIKRGSEILSEWSKKGLSSRRIVKKVGHAVAKRNKKATQSNSIEALAYLCALEMRVASHSKGFSGLFRFFSKRREKAALERFRFRMKIPQSTGVLDFVAQESGRLTNPSSERKLAASETYGGRSRGADAAQEAAANKLAAQAKKSQVTNGTKPQAEQRSQRDKAARAEAGKRAPDKEPIEVRFDEKNKTENNHLSKNGRDEIKKAGKKEEIDLSDDILFLEDVIDETPPRRKETLNFVDEIIVDNMVLGAKDIMRDVAVAGKTIPKPTNSTQTKDGRVSIQIGEETTHKGVGASASAKDPHTSSVHIQEIKNEVKR